MKFSIIGILIMLSLIVVSCNSIEDEPGKVTTPSTIKKIIGVAQKGSFNIGADVTISELDTNYSQTGRNFTSQIISNDGSFEISNLSLVTSNVILKVDGFYFNEVTGDNSGERLTLYAISDVNNQSMVNVNILSHLEKTRTEYLLSQGMSFSEAKKQAQQEVLSIFELEKDDIDNSEQLNLTQNGEGNAILLAISIILQGNRSVAELSELLANISLDIKTDGILDDEQIGSQLINDLSTLDLVQVRKNLEDKYSQLGDTVMIPDFESKIEQFEENTDFINTLAITYPSEGKYGPNLLTISEGDSVVSPRHYSLNASLPEGYSLKVRVRMTCELTDQDWFYATSFIGEVSPYDLLTNKAGDMVWTSKENFTDLDNRISFEGHGTGIMEIFENNSTIPTKNVNFKWYVPDEFGIVYPSSGKFGENILSKNENFILDSGQTYSLAANSPDTMNLVIDMMISKTSATGDFNFDNELVENWSVSKSSNGNYIFGRCFEPGTKVDMPIIFSGEGDGTIELSVYNGNQKIVLNNKFSWK